MTIRVIGISGSPVHHSNTDRAVRTILEATDLPFEFYKLSKLKLSPCRACLGCTDTNECVVQDDARMLADRFREADAVVLGGFTPYSSLDSMTKMFMERMYCLRHQTGLNLGKIGVSVITTAFPPNRGDLPPAAEIALSQIRSWMMEEGMIDLGSLLIVGNVPCIRCGHGDDCELSGVKMIGGQDAVLETLGVRTLEADQYLINRARLLGRAIHEKITGSSSEANSRMRLQAL